MPAWHDSEEIEDDFDVPLYFRDELHEEDLHAYNDDYLGDDDEQDWFEPSEVDTFAQEDDYDMISGSQSPRFGLESAASESNDEPNPPQRDSEVVIMRAQVGELRQRLDELDEVHQAQRNEPMPRQENPESVE